FYDIDVANDLLQLARELQHAPAKAPRTARWFTEWQPAIGQLGHGAGGQCNSCVLAGSADSAILLDSPLTGGTTIPSARGAARATAPPIIRCIQDPLYIIQA